MKIVHIIIGLNVGGAESMLQRLVIFGKKNSHTQHIIISLTDLGVIGSNLQKQGVDVFTLGMTSLKSVPLTFFKLRRLLKRIHPDVVQTWMYHADFLGGIAAKSLGIRKIIWGVRTTDVTQGNSVLTVKLANLCSFLSYSIPDKIICAANASKDHHISLGYDKNKMLVIPNGYNIDELIANEKDGIELRKSLHLSPNDIIIGSVGRYNKVKNQSLFVEAAAILIKYNSNLKFMLIGRDNNKNNIELTDKINRHNLMNYFILMDERDDIPKCMKAMDIFCLHSNTEGFPNVLVEALAAGLSCVSTDVGDAKYILKEYGSIVTPNNSKDLAHGIQQQIDLITRNKTLDDGNHSSVQYIKDNYSIAKAYKEFSIVWDIN